MPYHIYEGNRLFVYQISTRYLNPRLRYYYFWFLKINVRYVQILRPVSILSFPSSSACRSAPDYQILCKLNNQRQSYNVIFVFQDGGHTLPNLLPAYGLWRLTFKKVKTVCIPNFHQISRSTAEILLLPVSENKRSPYWNSVSGFDFYLFTVVDMIVIVHWPIKFCPKWTYHWWSHDVISIFKMAAIASQIYFRFPIWRCITFKKMQNSSPTKFQQVTSIHGWDITTAVTWKQTVAILKLLSVSIMIFSLSFMGMWFCIGLPNFVRTERSPTELWRHIDFKMAAISSQIHFHCSVGWRLIFKNV